MNIVISSAGVDWRGTDTVAVDLGTGLAARGHNVVMFCRPDSRLYERLHDKMHCEPVLSATDLSPRTIMRARAALSRVKADVVITVKDKDLRQTAVAARMLGIPVLVCHGTDRPLKNNLRYRFFFRHVATHHVANSIATRDTLLKSVTYLRDREIPVIYNGIDVDAFANAEPAELPVPPDGISVGFVGHFEFRKGIIDFAEAWQRAAPQIPNAHAVIVGTGSREGDFRVAMENAPRVHWLGFRKDVAALFKALDVFVMPSHFEGFGLVLAEAMAAGTAPVVYDVSSLPELVTHEHDGLLVRAMDTEALAMAIVRVCSDGGLRTRLATNASATARERFSLGMMVGEYEKLLQGIVSG